MQRIDIKPTQLERKKELSNDDQLNVIIYCFCVLSVFLLGSVSFLFI